MRSSSNWNGNFLFGFLFFRGLVFVEVSVVRGFGIAAIVSGVSSKNNLMLKCDQRVNIKIWDLDS